MQEWYEGESCIVCGESIEEMDYPEDTDHIGAYRSGAIYEAVSEDAAEGAFCLYCRENFDSRANTLAVRDVAGGETKVEYRDGIMFDHGMHFREYVSVPDSPHEAVVLAVVAGTGWHSTDAWRGYEDGPETADEWVRVKDTWHGTMTQTSASERVNALTAGEGPTPVAVAFTTTSNVMSLGIEVYAPEEDADRVEAFFDGATAGLDGGRF